MTQLAFIFDLDGVITDTAVFHFQAWKRLAEKLGITFDEIDNEQLKGVSRVDSLKWILAKGNVSLSEEEFETRMYEKNEDYKKLIESINEKDLFPGIREIMAELKKRNYKIGLASASRNARSIVQNLGIESTFEYIADSGKIPNGKPAPDIFLDVMNAFGMTADKCIGIEDAVAGVDAIKSAKMFAVGIGEEDVLNKADIIFSDIKTLDLERILTLHNKE